MLAVGIRATQRGVALSRGAGSAYSKGLLRSAPISGTMGANNNLRLFLNAGAIRQNSTASTVSDKIQTEIAPVVTDSVSKVLEVVPPDQIGYFQSVGLAQSWIWPSGFFQHIFEIVHTTTGMPWWATILAVTIGLRSLMFPLYMKASNASAKMTAIKPELNRLMKEYNASDDPIAAQKTMLERQKLMKGNNIKTSHLLLPVTTIPLFLGIFTGMNGMSKVPVAGLANEGLFWFQNLAAPDPYVGLQIMTALFYAVTFKLGGETGATTMSPAMKKVFTWMPFIAVPMTMNLPASVCYYFALNGVFSVMQTRLFQWDKFRKATGMAPIIKPPMNPEDNVGVLDTLKNTFEKAKERGEKAQRDAERELRLKAEKKAQEDSQYVRFTKKK